MAAIFDFFLFLYKWDKKRSEYQQNSQLVCWIRNAILMKDLSLRANPRVKKNYLLILKGAIIILWGVMALLNSLWGVEMLIKSFGVLNIVVAFATLGFFFANKQLSRSGQWLLLEGGVELLAGAIFTFFIDDGESFMRYIGYGVILVVILQFTHGYSLALEDKFKIKNMAVRMLTTAVGAIVSVTLLSDSVRPHVAFVIVGVFSILYGLLNMQLAFRLKNVVMGKLEAAEDAL